MSNGKLDGRAVAGSKVVGAFAKKRGTTVKAALKELERRAEFLKVTCERCKSTDEVIKQIHDYGL